MKNRIRIIKGHYNKIRIADCVFYLNKPLVITNGKVLATVNASDFLGAEYNNVTIHVEDYKMLD